jgi:hypothetical protein
MFHLMVQISSLSIYRKRPAEDNCNRFQNGARYFSFDKFSGCPAGGCGIPIKGNKFLEAKKPPIRYNDIKPIQFGKGAEIHG